jgi:hypothetical protein
LPGQREIIRRFSPTLHSRNFSSLSPALRQHALLRLVQALVRRLGRRDPPSPHAHLVIIDAMALSLTRGRGRACARLNDQTRGGGVLWAFWPKAPPGCGPLQVLSRMRGAWSDTKLIGAAHLLAHGPTYLLDRGFYAIGLIERWLARGVHFIVRARRNEVLVEPERVLGGPRRIGPIQVLRDEIGRLGKAGRHGPRPRVRLVWAVLPTGEDLILLSDQLAWGAGRLLGAYGQRGQIEPFHRLIKQEVGLAHLYSFQPLGIEVLLEVAVLLVLLSLLAVGERSRHTRGLMAHALQQLRQSAGLAPTRWRPNTPPGHRKHGPGEKGGEALVNAQNH